MNKGFFSFFISVKKKSLFLESFSLMLQEDEILLWEGEEGKYHVGVGTVLLKRTTILSISTPHILLRVTWLLIW